MERKLAKHYKDDKNKYVFYTPQFYFDRYPTYTILEFDREISGRFKCGGFDYEKVEDMYNVYAGGQLFGYLIQPTD
ncbi:hypothetical protein N9137_00805 [Pseudomonadales bacterium]|nr:hypothetical protein [Pseudomonadales bacterium]